MSMCKRSFKLFLLVVSAALLLSSCSNSTTSSDSDETGSISVNIEWPSEVPRMEQALNNPSIDCDASGISSVVVGVYEATGILLNDESFECSRGEGTLNGITAGTNRTVYVFGKDAAEDVVYRGSKTGVNISSGEINDIGTVALSSINPNADSDDDNVNDSQDNCPDTPSGVEVDANGCPLDSNDSDGDGVSDAEDVCLNTPSGLSVYSNGCPEDADFNNSVGMSFNHIPARTFTMGSPTDELARGSDETEHQVTLTNSFYIQITEVTQAQWEAVMGSNPSINYGCSDCPVDNVSWNDVQNFITALNGMETVEGTYSLPTEAQWECAARADTTTAYANGGITDYGDLWLSCGTDTNLDAMGWYCDNSDDTTHEVANKTANAWGLYDMHGNVAEWCQDWYGTYPSTSVQNPTGPEAGSERILRGGTYGNRSRGCRSADRQSRSPDDTNNQIGFRLIMLDS